MLMKIAKQIFYSFVFATLAGLLFVLFDYIIEQIQVLVPYVIGAIIIFFVLGLIFYDIFNDVNIMIEEIEEDDKED